MRISQALTYPADPQQVANMLADREFVLTRMQAAQATDTSADVQGDASGAFTVTSCRTQSTEQVPDSLRSFVGQGLTIRQTETWQAPTAGGARVGALEVEIVGLPVRFTGTMALEPRTDGTSQSVDGELKASIPLIGGRVEQAATPAIESAIQVEHQAGVDWLAHH